MARTAQARKVLRELQKELDAAGRVRGQKLEWSAAERAVLDLISEHFDRISDLRADYSGAEDVAMRLKLATELRLSEQAAARLLKQVKTDLAAAPSPTTRKAQRAANARWERARASGQ